MSIKLYDEALANKIQDWIKDDSIKVLRPEETSRLFRIKADEGKDKFGLPFIALSRNTEIKLLSTSKDSLSTNGATIRMYDNDSGEEIKPDKAFKLNAIPIQLNYQLDIYTKSMELADEFVRNFVFNFVNEPNLKIKIPYQNCNLIEESTVYLSESIQDNSDIPQRLFPDQFTRFTLELYIDNAYLWSVPVRDTIKIEDTEVCAK